MILSGLRTSPKCNQIIPKKTGAGRENDLLESEGGNSSRWIFLRVCHVITSKLWYSARSSHSGLNHNNK